MDDDFTCNGKVCFVYIWSFYLMKGGGEVKQTPHAKNH